MYKLRLLKRYLLHHPYRTLGMMAILILCAFFLMLYFKRRNPKGNNISTLENFKKQIEENYQLFVDAEFQLILLWGGYMAQYPYTLYKDQYKKLRELIGNKLIDTLDIGSDKKKTIQSFKKHYDKTNREIHNAEFVANEMIKQATFFDNIDGKSLDNQQREAIIKDEDNNLIIAGAGTGKTTTINGKVKYLTKVKGIEPKDILVISFTKKTVEDLRESLKIDGLNIETFNAFGRKVIAEKLGPPSVFDQDLNIEIIRIFNRLKRNHTYLKKVNDFILYDFKIQSKESDFKHKGDYINHLKEENFQPIAIKHIKGEVFTIDMIKVKSIEECLIANFLFTEGYNYEYEPNYPFAHKDPKFKKYKPDFVIYDEKTTIYLEHFGIDQNNNPPPFFSEEDKEKYIMGMNWKREFHAQNNTILIESYSYENYQNILLTNLKKKIKAHNILHKPKTQEEIQRKIEEYDNESIKRFSELLSTFIVLIKSNNYTFSKLRIDLYKNEISANDKSRMLNFLDLVEPIFDNYQQLLNERDEIDFSDMINLAANLIEKNEHLSRYKYLIIDEFQDLSIGRYGLIKALKKSNPSMKLFAVGDDWQSIYRFTGSDISLMKNFKSYFGATEFSKIETTYRFSNPSLKISSDFVQKNPNQINKSLNSYSRKKVTDIEIITYGKSKVSQGVNINLFKSLEEIILKHPNQKILILGRYSYDLNKLNPQNCNTIDLDQDEKALLKRIKIFTSGISYESSETKVSIPYLTVHKSKGLEADVVIVINNDQGKSGFPSLRNDDPILSLVLSENENFDNGEERRLFYVAITRAKKNTYLLAEEGKKSKFIKELTGEEDELNRCPSCITGNKVLIEGKKKDGTKWAFNGCSNYAFGCEFLEWI